MRQPKAEMPDDVWLDERKKVDLLAQLGALAKSYTPEWQFDSACPDIGSVIALLFCDQMQEQIARFNKMPDRLYARLINMLDISIKPAYPAHSIVLMRVVRDTVSGLYLPRATKLLAKRGREHDMVFETAHDIYLTSSRLVKAFMVSGQTGKICCVSDNETVKPFRLFSFGEKDQEKTGLILYHAHLFDAESGDIWMRIEGNDTLVKQILDGQYQLFFDTQSGLEPVCDMRMAKDNVLVFHKEKGGICDALVLEPVSYITKNVIVSDIRFSSVGVPAMPEYVANENMELARDVFFPFGRTLSLFAELFIGHAYFRKQGAVITLSFLLEYESVSVAPPKRTEAPDLKIIKRKPYLLLEETVAQVFADEIAISYYNGTGWKKLELFLPMNNLFRKNEAGERSIRFLCPNDWKETEVGGYKGYCLRIRLTRADNCYNQPAVHNVPIIKNMTVSYTYENNFERPQCLITYRGSRKTNITQAFGTGLDVPILHRSPYDATALYLGFDTKPKGGPVSLLFRIAQTGNDRENRLQFSYSAKKGFSRLKLTDGTCRLCHTGTVAFMPPQDWAQTVLEDTRAYWLRITDEGQDLENGPKKQPMVYEIALNAVEADNIETLEEETYVIDRYEPNMTFSLNARNILSVDVWVNETQCFSTAQMKRIAADNPDGVRLSYDTAGDISECYIKWSETDNFDRSKPNDRHYVVDRMNGILYFGDGVHVRIPQNTKGTAFRTVIRCCDGTQANVGANQVTDSLDDIWFVEDIHNPVPAFGGMDMERTEEALRRGSAMLNNHGRLISAFDFEREALSFSRGIAQAKAVAAGGSTMKLIILMEDYQDGGASFLNLQKRLEAHLRSKCAPLARGASIIAAQPIFLEISVAAWVWVSDADARFAVSRRLLQTLEDYLNPVKNDYWEIGRVPTEHQIALRLNMEKGNAVIRRMTVTAAYRDESGRHETDLNAYGGSPYAVVTSGAHTINIEQ